MVSIAARIPMAMRFCWHRARGFLEIAFCVVRKEEQRNGIGTRLLARLKEHALTLGVLHLLTYADDSATGFFEKSGFDPEHQAKYMGWAWGGRLDAWGYRLGA